LRFEHIRTSTDGSERGLCDQDIEHRYDAADNRSAKLIRRKNYLQF
jgi:hypothetical protein